MNSTSLYYFSLSKLETLIETYKGTRPDGRILEGFVFTPGTDDNGNAAVFAFPLFSSLAAGGGDPILIQNTNIMMRGCPYPPPCT
jgi:hypothetical protein